MDAVRATYRLDVPPGERAARAELLGLEQTVELPRDLVRDPHVLRDVVPSVSAIDGGCAVIDYPLDTTGLDPAQLLNVLFGNASLQPDVVLVDVELPARLATALGGPAFGIEGLRKAAHVERGALACTALKPMGLSAAALSERCETFARAGIDVIKDDHGLADQRFAPFDERVRACTAAIERAADATGHRSVYAPNLTGTPATLSRQLDVAVEAGAGAVLASPMLIGLPAFHELVQACPLPVLAHPALGGSVRIEPRALLGRLFRAYGADAVIYPSWGGRFSFDRDTCLDLAERLRAALHGLTPALPVPAGGMSVDRVPELLAAYGSDTMLLVGGSLYAAGGELLERSRAFAEQVHA